MFSFSSSLEKEKAISIFIKFNLKIVLCFQILFDSASQKLKLFNVYLV